MEILITALHPKVVEAVNKTIAEAKARGMTVAMHSGLRDAAKQQQLYDLGRTVANPDGKTEDKPMGNIITNAEPYRSWHNYGVAVDIVFKNEKGWTWEKSLADWEALGKVGEMFGFEWGGRWKKFPDLPHFQILGNLKSTIQAKELLLTKGVDALWALV